MASQRVGDGPPLSVQFLDELSPVVGYTLIISVAANALAELVYPVPMAAHARQRFEAFVLSAVDSMLDIARAFPLSSFPEEEQWVSAIETWPGLYVRSSSPHFVLDGPPPRSRQCSDLET